MRKFFLVIMISLFLTFSNSFALAPQKGNKPNRSEASLLFDSVVYGSKKDGLPDNLTVRGTITDVSFAIAECGGIIWAGTLKIKLSDKIESYPHENVFVVVKCFTGDDKSKYMNKIVSLNLEKIYNKKKGPCYFEIVTNTINSNGVPFYCALLGQEEILKIIEKENPQ